MIRLPGARRRRRRTVQELAADHGLQQFDRGIAVLLREGQVVGHVATVVDYFRTTLEAEVREPWVWLLVRWDDGTTDPVTEDYAPWRYVTEMQRDRLTWDGPDAGRPGVYELVWAADAAEAAAEWERLGISRDDF